jgi:ribosomal protein L37AE/L43A
MMEAKMAKRPVGRAKCALGKHTPKSPGDTAEQAIRRDVCRYCNQPILRTQATRIWFVSSQLA